MTSRAGRSRRRQPAGSAGEIVAGRPADGSSDRRGPSRYPRGTVTTIDRPTRAAALRGRPTSGAPASRPGAPAAAGPQRLASRGPVLVRQVRGGIEESVHRGDIVQVDVDGALIRGLGDPDRVANLRCCVKPFGVVALIEAGGIEAFDLEPAELALMASSHSGEDLHVRTLQALYRRAGVSQSLIATRLGGHAARRADRGPAGPRRREGQPGAPHVLGPALGVPAPVQLKGWDPTGYWLDDHPAQVAYRGVVARAFGTHAGDGSGPSIDGCGVATYAFPLREIARAYAFLADPAAVPARRPARRRSRRR